MPERIEKLKGIVQELEAELADLTTLDAESQRVLEEALRDLHTALSRKEPDALEPESLMKRFRAAEEEFQVSHPTLSGVVMRIVDALGQLGI